VHPEGLDVAKDVLPEQLFSAQAVEDRVGFFLYGTGMQALVDRIVSGFSASSGGNAGNRRGVEWNDDKQATNRQRHRRTPPTVSRTKRRIIQGYGRRCPTKAGEQILPGATAVLNRPAAQRAVTPEGCNCTGTAAGEGDLRAATRRRGHGI